MLSTHRSVNVPVASRNPMNGGTEEKEGRNGRGSKNRGKGMDKSEGARRVRQHLGFLFVSNNSIFIILICHIICKFDYLKGKNDQNGE